MISLRLPNILMSLIMNNNKNESIENQWLVVRDIVLDCKISDCFQCVKPRA